MLARVEKFCQEHGFEEDVELFKKGALVAQNPKTYEEIPELEEEDREYLRREVTRE